MTRLTALVLVLLALAGLMVTVMVLAFRGRRAAKRGADGAGAAADGPSDEHILAVIFGSIVAGMALTIVAGFLIFG
ncbi:MAG TPA: hypothetical protein VEG27_01120 [Usitatibacter sp.]|nr:hypothetical protein [Usitatibacter sp.]